MIKVTDLTKSYGDQVLFDTISFSLNRKERVGVIGRNGHGKTTLFSLLLNRIEPDSGEIAMPRGYRIGHLEQFINFTRDTVLGEACLGLSAEQKDDDWRAEKILAGLGFAPADMRRHPSEFSGGFQVRLSLAKVLVNAPDLLLLDEPTNYLDIVAIRWLENFLREWKGELMLITHDRSFMDSVTTHTMAIHRRKVRKIEGGTEKLYTQILQEEEIIEKTRINDEKKRKKTELFIRRFRAKARLAGMVQSRIKCLEKQEKLHELEKIGTLDFAFNAAPFPAAVKLAAHNISFSYTGREPYLVERFNLTIGKRDRICVIGKNGRGKSTLLKLLAGELAPVQGTVKRHAMLKGGYFGQTNVELLNPEKTVMQEVMESDPDCLPQHARDICGTLMFGGDLALKKISVLSGGEKSRVLLGKVLMSPCHLLLLDEPTNHLDMESCDSLLAAIDAFEGSVVMVTHSELFLRALADRLIVFDQGTVTLYEGGYREFLSEVGWEGENVRSESETAGRRAPSETDRKALKRARAELIQEKSRVLRPLEGEITGFEGRITALENELTTTNELLAQASTEGDVQAIRDLSKKAHGFPEEINRLYDDLDRVTREFERERDGFERRLAVFDQTTED